MKPIPSTTDFTKTTDVVNKSDKRTVDPTRFELPSARQRWLCTSFVQNPLSVFWLTNFASTWRLASFAPRQASLVPPKVYTWPVDVRPLESFSATGCRGLGREARPGQGLTVGENFLRKITNRWHRPALKNPCFFSVFWPSETLHEFPGKNWILSVKLLDSPVNPEHNAPRWSSAARSASHLASANRVVRRSPSMVDRNSRRGCAGQDDGGEHGNSGRPRVTCMRFRLVFGCSVPN